MNRAIPGQDAKPGGSLAGLFSLRRFKQSMRDSPPLRAVFLVGVAVLILVVLAATTVVVGLRAREIRDARRELFNLNTALSEEAGRTVQSVDLVLKSLLDLFRPDGAASAQSFARLRGDRATHDILREKIAGLTQLDALSIVDRAGEVINFSREYPIPAINVADRDYFDAARRSESDAPVISEPVQNRGTGTWTVYVARRISGPDGSFYGLMLGAIDLRYFENFYRSLQLGSGSATSIWRQDGLLLARYPEFDRIGKRFATPAFADVTPDSPPLVYQNDAAIDGASRLISRRVVGGYPLVVIVTRTTDSVLRNWRGDALAVAGAAVLGVIAVLLVMTVLARQFLTYEELEAAVRDREAAVVSREHAEAQLRQSQKLESMGQMTSSVAHDFNNLLTVVLGNLDLLASRIGRLDPSVQQALGRHAAGAQDGAERAAALARRLLAFSRRETLAPGSLDVNALVTGMGELMRHTLGRGIRLDLALQPGLPPAFVDASGLESALLNLVVNARDAMDGGGELAITSRREGDAIVLAVADTGSGMPPEVIERAFEPFFTTKPAGLGTGLGLAQVYGFAQQSSGSVTIESVSGKGTCITLRLPKHAGS